MLLKRGLFPFSNNFSGGDASRSKHITFHRFIINMINAFTSSAVNAITTEGDTVTIEFNGGRQYDYKSGDVNGFVNALNTVIKAEESVGRFVNFSIRNKDLEVMTATAA